MNLKQGITILIIVAIGLFVFTNPQIRMLFGSPESQLVGAESTLDTGSDGDSGDSQPYEMITLLPKDAIRSIDNPTFVTGAEADAQYSSDELVLGVEINGDARAYSIPFLSGHEIVNDVVGGQPIAVTW